MSRSVLLPLDAEKRIALIHRRLSDELPILPTILSELTAATHDEKTGAQDLARIILKDQTLATKVLRLVNSAQFRPYGRVTTVSRAVVLLGFNNLRNLAVSTALYALGAVNVERAGAFFRHSLTTAVLARMLGARLRIDQPEECFIAGLIHDIGRLFLIKVFAKPLEKLAQAVAGGGNELELEREMFGVDHAVLGDNVLASWSFLASYREPVMHHHQTDLREGKTLTSIVMVANQLARQICLEPTQVRSVETLASSVLGLDAGAIIAITEELPQHFKPYASIFELGSEDTKATAGQTSDAPNRRALELGCIAEISQAIANGERLGSVLHAVLEGVLTIGGFARVFLVVTDRANASFSLRAALGVTGDEEFDFQRRIPLSAQAGAIARAILDGRQSVVLDVKAKRYATVVSAEEIAWLHLRGFAVTPIRQAGRSVGALITEAGANGASLRDDLLLMTQAFANQAAVALALLSGPPPMPVR